MLLEACTTRFITFACGIANVTKRILFNLEPVLALLTLSKAIPTKIDYHGLPPLKTKTACKRHVSGTSSVRIAHFPRAGLKPRERWFLFSLKFSQEGSNCRLLEVSLVKVSLMIVLRAFRESPTVSNQNTRPYGWDRGMKGKRANTFSRIDPSHSCRYLK